MVLIDPMVPYHLNVYPVCILKYIEEVFANYMCFAFFDMNLRTEQMAIPKKFLKEKLNLQSLSFSQLAMDIYVYSEVKCLSLITLTCSVSKNGR